VSGVLALALKRMALSHGTVPSAVPVGQTIASGTNGTLGTNGPLGTLGTLSEASFDGDPLDSVEIGERAALAAVSVPPGYLDAWTQLQYHRPLSATGFALLHTGREGCPWACRRDCRCAPERTPSLITAYIFRVAHASQSDASEESASRGLKARLREARWRP
jgi:hypothetical protein